MWCEPCTKKDHEHHQIEFVVDEGKPTKRKLKCYCPACRKARKKEVAQNTKKS